MTAASPPRRPLRVGVIGLGWAGRTHLAAYQRLDGVEVAAIAAREPERLARWGDAYGVAGRYEHWRDLLERESLDAVSVALPTYLHAPVARAAFDNGCHVLCEKPLALDATQAEEIVAAATAAERVLQVAFNRRYRGDIALLKRAVDERWLGRVYYAKTYWVRRSGIPGLDSWFTNRAMAGGGPLIDLGVHVLDYALHVLGEPAVTAVSAGTHAEFGGRGGTATDGHTAQWLGADFDVEDLATALLRLEGGRTLLLEASWAMHRPEGDEFGLFLYGTDGGAELRSLDYEWRDTLRLHTELCGAPSEIRPNVPQGEGHDGVVRDFVETIHRGGWTDHVGRDALARARVIDACYASAAEGREVTLRP